MGKTGSQTDLLRGTVGGDGRIAFRDLPPGRYALGWEWDLRDATMPRRQEPNERRWLPVDVSDAPVRVTWPRSAVAPELEFEFELPGSLRDRRLLACAYPADSDRRLPAWLEWSPVKADGRVRIAMPHAGEVVVVLAVDSDRGGRSAWGISPVYAQRTRNEGDRRVLHVPEPGTVRVSPRDTRVKSVAVCPRVLAESGFRWAFALDETQREAESDLMASGPIVAMVESLEDPESPELGTRFGRQDFELPPGGTLLIEPDSGGERIPRPPAPPNAPFGQGR